MRQYSLTLLVAAGAALSCGSPTELSFLPTDLAITNVTFTGPPPPPLTVVTMPDTVRITGGIEMNVPCYDFTATATMRGDTIVVELVATERNMHCLQYVAQFNYTITIAEVSAGGFTLRLGHERRHTTNVRVRQTVLEQAIQVP